MLIWFTGGGAGTGALKLASSNCGRAGAAVTALMFASCLCGTTASCYGVVTAPTLSSCGVPTVLTFPSPGAATAAGATELMLPCGGAWMATKVAVMPSAAATASRAAGEMFILMVACCQSLVVVVVC